MPNKWYTLYEQRSDCIYDWCATLPAELCNIKILYFIKVKVRTKVYLWLGSTCLNPLKLLRNVMKYIPGEISIAWSLLHIIETNLPGSITSVITFKSEVEFEILLRNESKSRLRIALPFGPSTLVESQSDPCRLIHFYFFTCYTRISLSRIKYCAEIESLNYLDWVSSKEGLFNSLFTIQNVHNYMIFIILWLRNLTLHIPPDLSYI